METKEVNEKSKALQKATAAGESPENIVKILNDLKTGVVPTEDLLRSTKIGVIVNRSKQHKNPEVARLANDIVKKWRDDINKEKASSPNKTTNGASPKGTPPSSSADDNKSKSSVPPAERTWKKDGVDRARTGQSTRDNCIGLLYDGLCQHTTTAPSTVLSVATAIERSAFAEYGPENNEAYKAKIRSLYQNLKNKSNPQLRTRILAAEISPERFVVMTHEELKSAERRAEDDKIMSDNMNSAMAPQVERSISTSLTCGRCGQRKVSYSQAQTRSADGTFRPPSPRFLFFFFLSRARFEWSGSADESARAEPMTTFCDCTVCGK
ncbi:MAG: hypothetical protein LQ347_005196 [Umbilicaria vellea]|nr:MAG: hypothetical protein LQ347_005196 [Umbilicaria vellea]